MSLNPGRPLQYRPTLSTIQSSYYGEPAGQAVSVRERLGEIFNAAAGNSAPSLPMYKDKPSLSRREDPLKKHNKRGSQAGIAILLFLAIAWFLLLKPKLQDKYDDSRSPEKYPPKVWTARKESVKAVFVKTWDYYAKHAWGMDEFFPISQESRNLGCRPHETPCAPVGWIIVDSLDTAMIMNLTDKVTQARNWIATSLDFNKINSDLSTFETTIRILGGLLSAHYLSTNFPHLAPQTADDPGAKGEDLYIEKAVDLADRILGAYDTKSGIPLSSIVLNTSTGVADRAHGNLATTAEATTSQLELKYVAKLTGEPSYWKIAELPMSVIDADRSPSGLVPIFVDPNTGKLQGKMYRLGSRGDSYYEYLIKQFLQTGSREIVYKDMWDESLAGIKNYLITWSPHNFTVLGERQTGLNQGLTGKMDHLVCFLPGTIALATTGGLPLAKAKRRAGRSWGRQQDENLMLAEELMKTCWATYVVNPSGLAAEITYFDLDDPPRAWNPHNSTDWTMPRSVELTKGGTGKSVSWRSDFDIHRLDRHNLQRPETIESLFYLWRITGDFKYREWAWEMFQSFCRETAVYDRQGRVVGYSSIENVLVGDAPGHGNPLGIKTQTHGRKEKLIVGGKSKKDHMEGFWMSETLKYFYLIFEDAVEEWNDLEKVVFNTEAHVFPRFDIGEGMNGVWKTGWERKPKVDVEV